MEEHSEERTPDPVAQDLCVARILDQVSKFGIGNFDLESLAPPYNENAGKRLRVRQYQKVTRLHFTLQGGSSGIGNVIFVWKVGSKGLALCVGYE